MKSVSLILVVFFLFSCNSTSNNEKKTKYDKTKDPYLLVMKDKETCNLYYNYRKTFRNSLEGKWVEILTWVTNENDTCWYGVDYFNRSTEIIFDSNGEYKWNETSTDSALNHFEVGEYFITNKNDSSELFLAPYLQDNKKFKIGDNMLVKTFLLSWKNDSNLLLSPTIPMENEEYTDIQLLELKRQ